MSAHPDAHGGLPPAAPLGPIDPACHRRVPSSSKGFMAENFETTVISHSKYLCDRHTCSQVHMCLEGSDWVTII